MRSIDVVVEAVVTFAGAAGFAHTLAPLRRGQQDPCFRVPGDGTIWRTSLLPTGPVTARISRAGRDAARCVAWGSGAEEFVDMAPAMLGAADDASDFVPLHPAVAAAHRRLPNLRLGRTGQVLEALIPAVIEQRVPGADAFRSWRLLVSKYGTQAPGRATRHAGAAVGRGVASHPVLGVSSRQCRPGAGSRGGGLRAAGGVAGAAGVAARGSGGGGADIVAWSRGMDRGRDHTTRVR